MSTRGCANVVWTVARSCIGALAVGFVSEMNAAERRRHAKQGSCAPLHEIALATSAPVGFVPRLVVDRVGYVIRPTGFVDSCGFVLSPRREVRGVADAKSTTI
jgi:hypothetical protein